MDVVAVMVSYHSVHWIRAGVESYLEQFPGERLLVVDNNPRRGERGWRPDCERERHWLSTHPGVCLIDGPAADEPWCTRSHGAGVDHALDWCRRHAARVLLLVEPDVLVTGRQWRDNLLAAVAGGAWMAGGNHNVHGTIHPNPSAWSVADVRVSFRAKQRRALDEQHPRFRELVDMAALKAFYEPMGLWRIWAPFWDTGEKAWFEAAVHDRAALVPIPGYRHYWHGSTAKRLSEAAILAEFSELQPYLQRAAERERRPVESCPYRAAARGEGDDETARCDLLRGLTRAEPEDLCRVARDACAACCATFPPSPSGLNPVVASLLYAVTEQVIERGGVPGCSAAGAAVLQPWAVANLNSV